MAGYTWTTFLAALGSALSDDATAGDLAAYVPTIVQNAELRCYRDVDFLATRRYETSVFGSAVPVAENAIVGAPDDLVVIRSFGYYTPVGTTYTTGTWVGLIRVDETFVREYWPNRSQTGAPKYYSERNIPGSGIAQVIVAPTPDAAYGIEIGMTVRPAALSALNTTTWLATHAPDLFFAAAMVEATGWQRNYGAQSDDPKMAVSWEGAYQRAKTTAMLEEARRKSEGYADASPSQPPADTPRNM
jgi:hypothetical protein